VSKLYARIGCIFLLVSFAGRTLGQQVLVSDAKKKQLADLSVQLNNQHVASYQKALQLAKIHNWPVFRLTKDGGVLSLQGVNSLGFPEYLLTYNNTIAAATTGTNTVQPGGLLGLNLSGSSPVLSDKLAIWDGGLVYAAHQEFAGKTITLKDAGPVADHATHVAGTMIAKGVFAPSKGMAFNATTLQSYDFNNDIAEMSAAAPGLLLSNHSYGDGAGWDYDQAQKRWEWFGLPGDTVDYNFGFYGQRTKAYDDIAYNAPYYLIVEAAGNAHGYPGPPVGSDYWGYQSSSNQTLVDMGPRQASISSNGWFDVISSTGNAKNILTVGAVNPLPNGPASSSGITIASFSSWGPTDDGRVKPDIVGDGVNVLSTGSSSPSTYITLSGTSMATPNVTGSLYLLQEYYSQKYGSFMRAATLKGLACHTAFDAGNPGPDYIYGWGLLDMKQAAQAITDNGKQSLILEKTLSQGQRQTFNVVASGLSPLIATICWTDPSGTPTPSGTINSRVPKLVNDLDIRVSDGTTTFFPWILDPSHPSRAAQKGDNIVDNVEQVFIPGAVLGKTYTITVSHKGGLQLGSQDYSLIVTGINTAAYCASGPTSPQDSRIDNVTLSNINNTPAPGCTSYSDYTNLTVQLQQWASYPLSIALGTCGANFDKAAKVYIDWNGDGVFQANELVATTTIVTITGTYNTTITVPGWVVPGTLSRMRVVLTETSDVSVINPCGPYAKGETQDYTVQFTAGSPPTPGITTSVVTGIITTCLGSASTIPNIQQFQVSGLGLTGNITATAQPGFEISLTAASGYGNSLNLAQMAGSLNATTIFVRVAASAPAGSISGKIILTSPGFTKSVTVTGQVATLPVVNNVPNQGPYANGATTQAINFTGTANTYTWVNDTPGIGLPASGTGNIQPFTAINNSGSPITATVTVTPVNTGYAYVANLGSNDVSVINTTTNAVVNRIPVQTYPNAVEISPDNRYVYIANNLSNSVSVISTATNSVIANITVGNNPLDMALSADGSKLYVVCNTAGTLWVINTATNTAAYGGPLKDTSEGICVSPDGTRVYVTNASTGEVLVISAASFKTVANIQVAKSPLDVIFSPDGTKLYVANEESNSVSVVDAATNVMTAIIPVGNIPWKLVTTPDGSLLFVANEADNSISVINTATNQVVSTISSGGSEPFGLSVSPDGTLLYVVNVVTNDVSVISTTTNAIVTTIPVGSNPYSYGNFITHGPYCSGIPITFTITVLPSTPAILAGNIAADISACAGTLSQSSNTQFTVSGSNLTAGITATASPGFEVSLAAGSGYAGNVVLSQTAGMVSNALVYVRLAAAVPAGSLPGKVTLTSAGATTQIVPLTADVSTSSSPSVSIAASANGICAGTPVTFTATLSNGGSAPVYQWQLNGNTAGTNSASFASNTLANGDVVTCIVASGATCAIPANATSNSIPMIVNPAPMVNAGGNKTIKKGNSIQLEATATGNITGITWTPATGLSNNTILDPVASPSATTTYTLTVQTSDGCTGMDTMTITVLDQIDIPNTFTPNGDGINDKWVIQNLAPYQNCTVRVFNRWGQTVYSSIGYGTPWDGRYNGSILPAGTYYYIIDPKNDLKTLSGYITILR